VGAVGDIGHIGGGVGIVVSALIGGTERREVIRGGHSVDGFVPGDLWPLALAHLGALLTAAIFFLLRAILEVGLALTFGEGGFSIGHGTSRAVGPQA
jgi:hypothetical protein